MHIHTLYCRFQTISCLTPADSEKVRETNITMETDYLGQSNSSSRREGRVRFQELIPNILLGFVQRDKTDLE